MHDLRVRAESQVPAHVGVWLAPVRERAALALLLHLHAGHNHQVTCHTLQSEPEKYITAFACSACCTGGVGIAGGCTCGSVAGVCAGEAAKLSIRAR